MTVVPSPVRKVVSNSDDDEEKVAVKRLLSFTNQSGKYLHYTDYVHLWDYGTEATVQMVKTHSLLDFRGEPRNETKLVISWKQYCGLDSGCRYASFVSKATSCRLQYKWDRTASNGKLGEGLGT